MSHFYVYVINFFRLKLQLCLLYSKGGIAAYGLYIWSLYNICDYMEEKRKLIYSKLLEYPLCVSSTVTGMLYKISVFHFHNKVIHRDHHVSFIMK